MNVAILHHHLNQGGVTQVIANHLRSLAATGVLSGEDCRVAVMYGGRREGWPHELPEQLGPLEVSLVAVPGLDYDTDAEGTSAELAEQLKGAFASLDFSADSTLLHVHNHSLGKNVSLPGALTMLARDGYRMLLHIHDFPEDFRPDNYRRLASVLCGGAAGDLPLLLYPQAPQIHYAVLNGRDYNILRHSGIGESHLHLLANPARPIGHLPSKQKARGKLAALFGVSVDCRFLLYPVRGIRRKNLGEALLWSALNQGQGSVGITLAPLNPLEQKSYSAWKALAVSDSLPCVFELGAEGGLSFTENLAAADCILTTSVAEGFGMVFLESWLAGRALVGRDLPEITADFVAAGIQFDPLQGHVSIPLDWVGKVDFFSTLEAAYIQASEAYGRPPTQVTNLQSQIDALIHDGLVDFGILSSKLQWRVIENVLSGAGRRKVLDLNPSIQQAFSTDVPENVTENFIEQNAEAVRTGYSLECSGRRLREIYQAVLASPRSDQMEAPADGTHILNSFLDLSRLNPIRLET